MPYNADQYRKCNYLVSFFFNRFQFSEIRAFNIFIFALLFSITSCNTAKDDLNRSEYFDLQIFITDEINRLRLESKPVTKKVFLNGKSEEQQMLIENWENELKAFSEANINKKSFFGNYRIDTLKKDEGISIKYKALRADFNVKEMVVDYDAAAKPVKVSIFVSTKNTLYNSSQQLVYEPRSGYEIQGKQKVRFLEADTFSVYTVF